MGLFFQVDLDVLKQFVSALHESDDHMQAALKSLASASEGNEIGTDDLNSAAEDFQKSWHYGMTQITSMIKETGDTVSNAHASYQQLEQEAKQALGKMASGL